MAKFQIKGTEELEKKLKAINSDVSDKIETAIKSGALIVQNDSKKRVPYKTGTLRRSIHMETVEKSKRNVKVKVGTDVPYARRIEYGFTGEDSLGRTFNQPAQPYLRPSLDENTADIQKEIAGAMKQVFRKFGV